MKKQFAAIALSIAAVLVLTAASANAQSMQKMTVNIPFEFSVAGTTYEAGEYTFGRFSEQQPMILILKKKNGTETITLMKDTDKEWRAAGYFVK